MASSEFKRRYLACQEFSFGPLRWRSTTVHEAEDLDSAIEGARQTFVERLQDLIRQAHSEACTAQELTAVLSRHTLGDHHGDA